MNPVKRFLTAFIFYPLLVLWFIPREYIRAFKKARRMGNGMRSIPETFREAKSYFNQELKVAMASRSRKPIDYSYLDETIKDMKKMAEAKDKQVEAEILGKTNVEEQGRSGN